MKIEYESNDISIYQSIIKTYEKVFISPYSSFNEAESSLSDIYLYLNKYCNLLDNNYLYLTKYDYLIPEISFSQEFIFFLKLSLIKKVKYAKEIVDIIQKLYRTDVFDSNYLTSNNPYLTIFNQINNDSELLINKTINYSQFIDNNIKNLNFLFPTSQSESSDYADLIYLNDPIIHQLKEKIYLNLLIHFIQFPEQYTNVSYLFIDFIDFFSFNKNQSYSFSHLKNIFLRLNENHFNIIASLKSHPLYDLFIETLFIDYSEPVRNLDNDNTDYTYYFDFNSLNIIVHKKLLIDNLFNQFNEYSTLSEYFSTFKNNSQENDLQRFKKLMIVYEKNKLENKLSIKNFEDSIIKI